MRPGDTLWAIGQHVGVPWPRLWAENRGQIPDPNRIHPGEVLVLCGASSGAKIQFVAAGGSGIWHDEPCRSSTLWPQTLYLWETPVGCYGSVYWVGKGDCYGWVHYLVPQLPALYAHATPRSGAVAHIPAFDQGASGEGHWVYILALHGNWALVSEENMYWRGGGYNKVTYRYLLLTPGMQYFY